MCFYQADPDSSQQRHCSGVATNPPSRNAFDYHALHLWHRDAHRRYPTRVSRPGSFSSVIHTKGCPAATMCVHPDRGYLCSGWLWRDSLSGGSQQKIRSQPHISNHAAAARGILGRWSSSNGSRLHHPHFHGQRRCSLRHRLVGTLRVGWGVGVGYHLVCEEGVEERDGPLDRRSIQEHSLNEMQGCDIGNDPGFIQYIKGQQTFQNSDTI